LISALGQSLFNLRRVGGERLSAPTTFPAQQIISYFGKSARQRSMLARICD
jgi:hypothetical protein